jgi:hypothetical protein
MVFGSGILTILLGIGAVFYLLSFTTRHYGNASLRLYESRYVPKLPKSDGVVRYIHLMKPLYTKDVLAALIAGALLVNLPILIAIFAPLIVMQMFAGFIYCNLRYANLTTT